MIVLIDGFSIAAAYVPAAGTTEVESSTDFAVEYTGFDGLTLGFAQGENNAEGGTSNTDNTTMYVKYAYGPVTATVTESEFDVETTTSDQEVSSMAVSYTVSDEISVTYGTETIESTNAGHVDAEYTVVKGSYTSGGMTISAQLKEAENIDHSTNANADMEYWGLGLAFAF